MLLLSLLFAVPVFTFLTPCHSPVSLRVHSWSSSALLHTWDASLSPLSHGHTAALTLYAVYPSTLLLLPSVLAQPPCCPADVLKFNGPGPELINGRLAMLAFLAVPRAEVQSGDTVLQQALAAPWWVYAALLLWVYASMVPLLKGARHEAFGELRPSSCCSAADAALWECCWRRWMSPGAAQVLVMMAVQHYTLSCRLLPSSTPPLHVLSTLIQ